MVQRYKLYLRYPNIYGKYYIFLTFISIIIQNSEASYKNLPHCFNYKNHINLTYSNFLGSKFP